jgi:succinoglycan biosynthesis protein ExoM
MAILYSLCVCTYRRPTVIDTVASLFAQQGVSLSEVEIIVADDDPNRSARESMGSISQSAPVVVRYVESAARNISTCRNVCLRAAKADWIAFIDDDQTVEPDWLQKLIIAAEKSKADAVKCYVRGIYPLETPRWVRLGGAYTYDYGPNGTEVNFGHTCGILFRRDLSGSKELLFDVTLGVTGGEDIEFFMRYKALGGKIISCRDAVANEIVSVGRVSSVYLKKRWRRQGHIIVRVLFGKKKPVGRYLSIMKSIAGVVVASLYFVIRIVHPAMGCWMFMKFWYHFGVLESALGRDAFYHE